MNHPFKRFIICQILFLLSFSQTLAVSETLFKDYNGDFKAPESFDFAPPATNYSFDLTSIKNIPLNGSIEWQIYLTKGSRPGTIFDTYGSSQAKNGDMYVDFNNQGIVNFVMYNTALNSSCKSGAGLHVISTKNSLYANFWNKIKIKYGLTGMKLYLNDKLETSCDINNLRKPGTFYLGDFPDDKLDLSFVGYFKDLVVENNDDEISQIFTDVNKTDKYYEAIKSLYERGIIEGYPDGSFKPEDNINRAEIVKILLTGFNKSIMGNSTLENVFTDIKLTDWYAKFIYSAKKMGIISGYPDGNFYPEKNINRVEFLKMLMITTDFGLNITDIKKLPPDINKDDWYVKYVQFSMDNNLIELNEKGLFDPAKLMTRGEVTEAIYRLEKILNTNK